MHGRNETGVHATRSDGRGIAEGCRCVGGREMVVTVMSENKHFLSAGDAI